MARSLGSNDWYAVAGASGLPPGDVMPAGLLGADIAVWRETSGAVHAWDSRCPHRGMRLSSGFVRGDRLGCLYHGWQFDGAGRCAHIPSRPDRAPPAAIRTAAFPVAEDGGLIWVSIGSPAGPPPTAILAKGGDVHFCARLALARDADEVADALPRARFLPVRLAERADGRPVTPVGAREEGETRVVRWRCDDGTEHDVSYALQTLSAATVAVTARLGERAETVVMALQPVADGRSALHVTAMARAGDATALRLHYARWARRLRWFLENGGGARSWNPIAPAARARESGGVTP